MKNFTELVSPVRIYWDIDGRSGAPGHERICEQLVENRILSLNLLELSPSLTEASLSILERLKQEPIALSLTASRYQLSRKALKLLLDLKVKTLFVRISSCRELPAIAGLLSLAGRDLPLGVAFEVTGGNYAELPGLLSFCTANRIGKISLPIQRLFDGRQCFYLPATERRYLAQTVGRQARPPWLKLIIHDPFLWKVFHPAIPSPDCGCQAANTMLYISPDGGVYPCPSLPVKIGDLATTSLKNIILSKEKRETRSMIAAEPVGCRGCPESDACKGGCRGRAQFLKKSFDEPDPACIRQDNASTSNKKAGPGPRF